MNLRAFSALLLATSCLPFSPAQIDPNLYSGLKWRNIGPFRGGRVSAVSGVIGQPGTFYAGFPLGGVWKTTSAGETWAPIFDSVKDSSCVGALEVAPSDPNLIYVGMGDLITGGGINEGDGVYKSTDAGKTWQHLGLEATKQIPSILVDPKDPNLVMVAAQGDVHMPSESRGLFRSTDGGKSWQRTLFVDKETGLQKITWAFDNPSVMLATTVRHYSPAGAPRGSSGTGGTAVFKSTDEGLTWKKLSGGGLPSLGGRTSVAIAKGTNSQRMYLVGNFGLYRSDDGGEHWRQMAKDDNRIMNGQGGYNCGVYVSPSDPETVYVISTCSYLSRDGGKTFTGFKGAPGGDDPQQMWIDPTDSKRLFFGTDQGATVSLDGGLNWSSWYNQPTGQVYHISVDTQFPYWVYATQQDSGSIGTRSRGDLGAITPMDWTPHPGYEFGSIVADPLNPNITYAGGPAGDIIRTTQPGGQWSSVSPNIDSSLQLRKVGNQPLLHSPTNPRELITGYQFLMSTTDGGLHWKKLSPDLGFPKGYVPPKPETPAKPKVAGGKPAVMVVDEEDEDEEEEEGTPHQQGARSPGGAIQSISVSSVDGNVIWVGTNNGLIHLTKDHGKTWDEVTIPKLPNPTRSDMSSICASNHMVGEAYVAIDTHGMGDYTPSFYRTRDFGKTWTKIVEGLATNQPNGSFSRVIKADPVRAGLLYAGTESSMYVSFDDGDHWQSLMLNLPTTSFRDLAFKDNDLVVGTYGRSFWVLDDLTPLRQIAASQASEAAHLFQPGDAIRVRRNVNGDTPFPPEVPHALNPPVGALIYYYLGAPVSGEIDLTITDAKGKFVRRMSSAPIPSKGPSREPVPDFWLEVLQPMPTTIGTIRINWNLRYENPPAFGYGYGINANPFETSVTPEGPLVAPGKYRLTLKVNGKAYEQWVTVKNDPRSPASSSDLRAQSALQESRYEGLKLAWAGYQKVAAMRASIAELLKKKPVDAVSKAAEELDSKLSAFAGAGGGRRFGGGGTTTSAPTFAGVHGAFLRQLTTLDSGDMKPNASILAASRATDKDWAILTAAWNQLQAKEIAAFDALIKKNAIR